MREFEIFWDDLSSEAKQRLISEGFEAHENIGILPIAIINQEEEVEKVEKIDTDCEHCIRDNCEECWLYKR